MFCMRMGHIPQPVRAYGGSLFDRLLRLPAGFTHLSSAASQRLPPNRRPGPRLSPAFAGPVVLRRAGVHVLRIGFDKGRGGREPCGQHRRQLGGRFRSCVPPSRQSKGRDGVSLFRAPLRGRARGAAGGRIAAARFARVIARARRHTHLARRFPPGSFSRPPASRFLQKRRKAAPGAASLYFHSTPYR